MKDINIKEIIDLAAQDISDPESEIKQVYKWYHERKVMSIKGTVSISISLIITLGIAYYKSEIQINNWTLIFPLIFALLTMTYGVYELVKLRRLGRKYIAAISLLDTFIKIKPFLNLYRALLYR